MSYPISGLNKTLGHVQYKQHGYKVEWPIIPHGISVAIPAPAVFRYTGASSPERHLECASILGIDTSKAKQGDGEHAGALLAEGLVSIMDKVGLPLGLGPLGFKTDDIELLVEGTLPQKRLTGMLKSTSKHIKAH